MFFGGKITLNSTVDWFSHMTSCLKLWQMTSCRLLESRAGPWGSLPTSVLRASYAELPLKPFLCVQPNKGKQRCTRDFVLNLLMNLTMVSNFPNHKHTCIFWFCIDPFQMKTNWELQTIKPVILQSIHSLCVGSGNFSEPKYWLRHNFWKFLRRQLILTSLGNITLKGMDIDLI